jgi:hypothetical protein
MIALCAKADLIVADEFPEGNIPANQLSLSRCGIAFHGLPRTVKQRCLCSDSACHEGGH